MQNAIYEKKEQQLKEIDNNLNKPIIIKKSEEIIESK